MNFQKWFEFLKLCDFEMIILRSLHIYIKHVSDTKRRSTYVEMAFNEFKYMWE